MDVKDPTVFFMKSRRAIAGTMAKLQMTALTNRWHCISGTDMPSVNYATHSLVLHTKEEEEEKDDIPARLLLPLSPLCWCWNTVKHSVM